MKKWNGTNLRARYNKLGHIIVGCLVLFAGLLGNLSGQIHAGKISGTVSDPTQASISGATVKLYNPTTGFNRQVLTNFQGIFSFNNTPFDHYLLQVKATGFQTWTQKVRIRSNLPLIVNISLKLMSETQTIQVVALIEEDSLGMETDLDQSFIEMQPSGRPADKLQQIIGTAPGWISEDNGLLHVRGVDNGLLFVLDGIPLTDRIDPLFGATPQYETIESIQLINGHIPVEYGYASGAVVQITPKSGIDRDLGGSIAVAGGNFQTGQASYTLGGNLKKRLGFYIGHSLTGSGQRYLDPIHPRNLNNRGIALRFNSRIDWHPTNQDNLIFNVGVHDGRFRITNTPDQEVSGQRQRQKLANNHQSVTWQKTWSPNTVTDIGGYHRYSRSELLPSPNDTPISASQLRKHSRSGLLINLIHFVKGHTLKVGTEGQRVTPDENFSFFITDKKLAEKTNISPMAILFDQNNPFSFRDSAIRWQGSGYVQDTFSLKPNWIINAGFRFDRTTIMVSDSLLSPRVGTAFYLPTTETVLRASYNRLFMPPQLENLLLSSSQEAFRLSPFADQQTINSMALPPEKQHAFETGFGQSFGNWFQLNAAYWWRLMRNSGDPNVFFGTSIIFPNSVNKGKAQGLEARIDFPQKKGWSGYLSYSNSRIFQIGPINGGLFLEDDIINRGLGIKFNPDHDQRNTGAFGVVYRDPSGIWISFSGRHASGTPLEVDPDELKDLKERPGSDLVNFKRRRMKPRSLFDFSVGKDFSIREKHSIRTQFDVQNLTNKRFAYNFGNPFSGTHFGHPRLWSGRIRFSF